MGIGQNIKEIRKSKGMTQKQLGDLLGVTQAAIGQFENDKSNLTIETVNKIAAALNIDPYSLYSFEMASEVLTKDINNQEENTLLNYYRKLNDAGQDKAIEQMEMLTKIPEFAKDEEQALRNYLDFIKDKDSNYWDKFRKILQNIEAQKSDEDSGESTQ